MFGSVATWKNWRSWTSVPLWPLAWPPAFARKSGHSVCVQNGMLIIWSWDSIGHFKDSAPLDSLNRNISRSTKCTSKIRLFDTLRYRKLAAKNIDNCEGSRNVATESKVGIIPGFPRNISAGTEKWGRLMEIFSECLGRRQTVAKILIFGSGGIS